MEALKIAVGIVSVCCMSQLLASQYDGANLGKDAYLDALLQYNETHVLNVPKNDKEGFKIYTCDHVSFMIIYYIM